MLTQIAQPRQVVQTQQQMPLVDAAHAPVQSAALGVCSAGFDAMGLGLRVERIEVRGHVLPGVEAVCRLLQMRLQTREFIARALEERAKDGAGAAANGLVVTFFNEKKSHHAVLFLNFGGVCGQLLAAQRAVAQLLEKQRR